MTREIVEDTISRNRKFKEERLRRIEGMKKAGSPLSIIEREQYIATLTPGEYEIFKEKEYAEDIKNQNEYAKNNPIQKQVVDEIYKRMESLDYKFMIYSSRITFLSALQLLKFMSKDDYHNCLYDTFINHALEIYQQKYEENWKKDNPEN